MTEQDDDHNSGLSNSDTPKPAEPARKPVSEAAARALAEAAERRAALERQATPRPKERHGRDGPDPARYGDWENKGIASDF